MCALLSGPDEILATARIATTTPEEVFGEMAAFFRKGAEKYGEPRGIGVATFGPVDLRDPESSAYGVIMKTPKPDWEGANWQSEVRALFPRTNFAIDTDVNAAALAEIQWGVARGLENVVYFTIGTGIGIGVVANGKPLHGLLHPEGGHIRIPRSTEEQVEFAGICPFHGDCLEGIASGPAIEARWGRAAEDLPSNHPAWEVEADVLSWACINLICTTSPERIIIGGGVSQQESFFPLLREKVVDRLNGYVDSPEITERIDQYIVPPALGQNAGLLGALALLS